METRLASDLLLNQLAAEGTRIVFGVPGPNSQPVLESIQRRKDVSFITALHETIAGFMASGYAQASGKTGVVSLGSPASLTSALPAVQNASRARIPLLLLASCQDKRALNEQWARSGHPCKLSESLCKWVCEINFAEELPRVIRRAFHEATAPPWGPVLVALPEDLLRSQAEDRLIPPPGQSLPGPPDGNFLKRAVQMLKSAAKPVIIAGNEVAQFKSRKEVVALAEVLGAPVFSEPVPSGLNFPSRHPLFAGVLPLNADAAQKLLQPNDVVLALGVQTRVPANYHPSGFVPKQAVVIQINQDPTLAGIGLPCHLCAIAEIAETVSRVRAEIQFVADPQWVAKTRARCRQTMEWIDARQSALREMITRSDRPGAVPIAGLLSCLDALRPKGSCIVNDAGSCATFPMYLMNLDGSSSYFATNGGNAGYGLSAALGVQLASLEHTVVCLVGDGSLLHLPQALWSAAHHQLPVKVIVLNNQGWATLKNPEAMHLPEWEKVCPDIKNPCVNFGELARAMSVPAMTVADADSIENALTTMLNADGPYLLDVRVEGAVETEPAMVAYAQRQARE